MLLVSDFIAASVSNSHTPPSKLSGFSRTTDIPTSLFPQRGVSFSHFQRLSLYALQHSRDAPISPCCRGPPR